MLKKRIGNIEFRECTYLGNTPEIKSWELCYYYPNSDYGQEHLYEKDGDFYVVVYDGIPFRKHKSCFLYKECCCTLGVFEYDGSCWNFQFVCARPLVLNTEEREIFWELLDYGYKELSDGSDR